MGIVDEVFVLFCLGIRSIEAVVFGGLFLFLPGMGLVGLT